MAKEERNARPGPLSPRARQSGFIPGAVIEINIAIVVALVLVGILMPASQSKFKPVPVEPNPAYLAAAAAAAPAGSTCGKPRARGPRGWSWRSSSPSW